MAKKAPLSVDAFMQQLEHPLKDVVEQVRAFILAADSHITERIKWNAPSFCYAGDDRVTFKLHPPDKVQLVFHRGAKVKDPQGFTFADESGLLEWVAADRALVTLRDLKDARAKKAALARVVVRWMKATT